MTVKRLCPEAGTRPIERFQIRVSLGTPPSAVRSCRRHRVRPHWRDLVSSEGYFVPCRIGEEDRRLETESDHGARNLADGFRKRSGVSNGLRVRPAPESTRGARIRGGATRLSSSKSALCRRHFGRLRTGVGSVRPRIGDRGGRRGDAERGRQGNGNLSTNGTKAIIC
jgi:hypothetical protein